MFRIWKDTEDSEGNKVTKSIQVKNHRYLEEYLLNMGIGLTKVNFFSYNALPDRSYGVFVVSEEEWLSVMPDVSGDIKLNLTIEDQYAFKVFKDLSVVKTAFIMSPIAPGAAQDNQRLLILELELDRDFYHSMYPLVNGFSTWDVFKLKFKNGELLEPPEIFENNFASNSTMLVEALSYVADVNFLTAYLDPENAAETYPVLTDEAFDHTLVNLEARLLYNDVTVAKYNPKFNLFMFLSTEGVCTPSQQVNENVIVSDLTTVDLDNLNTYVSPVNSNSVPDKFYFEIGYSRLDSYKHSIDSESSSTFINDFADAIKENGKTRFSCSYDLIYEGVVNVKICNNLHHIDYYFGEFGLRTRLRTRQWNPNESILIPKNIPCEDKIFKALVLKNFPSVGSQGSEAIIYKIKPHTAIPQVVVDASAFISSPLGVFKWYTAGTTLLVYKACTNCEYHIIQGPCPPSSPSVPEGDNGKCCLEINAENPITFCYELKQSECNLLGGSWSAGSCGANPETACSEE